MRRFCAALLVLWGASVSVAVAQEAVPKGEVTKYSFQKSKVFPGTVRDFWVYVPQQYDAAKPACVYVNQDGVQYNALAVFDELIHKKEMPVTIGIFVTPGRVKATSDAALDRFKAGQETARQLARDAARTGQPVDHVEASILDTRARAVALLLREQALER